MSQTMTPTFLHLTQLWSLTMKEMVLLQAAWAPSRPLAQTRTRTMTILTTGDHASRNWLTCTTRVSYPIGHTVLLRAYVYIFLPKRSGETVSTFPILYIWGRWCKHYWCEWKVCVWIIDQGICRSFSNWPLVCSFERSTLSCERRLELFFFSCSAVMDQRAISPHLHDSSASSETKADSNQCILIRDRSDRTQVSSKVSTDTEFIVSFSTLIQDDTLLLILSSISRYDDSTNADGFLFKQTVWHMKHVSRSIECLKRIVWLKIKWNNFHLSTIW